MTNASGPVVDRAAGRAERRSLTVLFADVVGSSALAARLDPEDLRDILHRVQATFREAIGRYDGHLARYLGDGALACFGFPVAHEDDAERAVNAALEMIEAVSALPSPEGPALQLHIGIATGLVVVGDRAGEGDTQDVELVGGPVNLAASLQVHAAPGEILISPRTRRLVGALFDVADLGERSVKGHEQPVRVWSVLRRSAVQARFDARQSAGLTPFVGRDRELARLEDAYERAKAGEARLVTVSGDPGIGKSRLILALRERLAAQAPRTFFFQCSSRHTSSPWHPVIRHLEDAAGIERAGAPALKLARLEGFVARWLPDRRDEVLPLMAALLSIPTAEHDPAAALTPQQRKRRTLAALLDLFRAQAAQQPAIFVFEDVHWIDPSSLELLDLVRNALEGVRRLVIVSCRPEYRPPWPEASGVTPVVLGALEPTQAARMVASLAADRVLPAAVAAQIVRKTDGVPLFVEEMTRAVLQELAPDERPPASGADPLPAVPDTLHDLLMARLDQCPALKTLAQVAATIGREFSLDLLAAVAPLPAAELRAGLDGLVAGGLVLPQGGEAGGHYAFRHALVQDTAYASLLREERRRLHLRIAEALCERFGDVAESAPELVAHHYTQARVPAPAAAYWLKAGRQASGRSAFVEATIHFESALKLLAQLPESEERDRRELELQQALASALIAARGFGAGETLKAFERALALCDKHPGTPHIFAVLNGLVGVHYMRGDFRESRRVAQDLLARAERRQDRTALLMAHRVLGMCRFATGELEPARTHLQQAIALYDPAQHAPLALVFSQDFRATAEVYLGLASVLAGEVEDGLRHCREALAYAERLSHPHSICYVLPFLGGAHVIAGSPEAACAIAERTLALSAEYGFPQWGAGGLLVRGWAQTELGSVEDGIADLEASIAGLEANGTLFWGQFARFLLAEALARAGRRDAAAALVKAILAATGASVDRWYGPEVHRLKGDLLRAAGAPVTEVAVAYEAAQALALRQGARLWQRRAAEALAGLRPGRASGDATNAAVPDGATARRLA